MLLQPESEVESLGAAADRCIREAFAIWRKMYYPTVTGELAFTEEAYKVVAEITQFQAGRLQVRVYVHARKAWQRENYLFNFVKGPNGTYLLEGKA